MSAPAPKGYQREAVVNALEIFRYAESQLRQADDEASRAAATAYNGCLLLEAPTGSGKTLMAGMIAETFSAPDRDANAHIVWFWFTPFAGLVEQAKGAIKSTFVGLRVRDLQGDRKTRGTRSGDVIRHHLGVSRGGEQGNAPGAQWWRVCAVAGRLDRGFARRRFSHRCSGR